MRQAWLLPISVCLAVLLLAGTGCENYHGNITGRVMWVNPIMNSPHFAAIPQPMQGIYVVAKSLKDGSRKVAWTDCDGYYTIMDARFGPNQVTTDITKSQDILDGGGNPLCAATATYGFYSVRNFVDVQKNKTARVDFEITEIPKSRNAGITVLTKDALTDEPVKDVKVDLYSGLDADYALVDSKLTDRQGLAVFYNFATRGQFVAPPFDFVRPPVWDHNVTTFNPKFNAFPIQNNQLRWFHVFAAKPGYENARQDFLVTHEGPEVYFIVIRLFRAP